MTVLGDYLTYDIGPVTEQLHIFTGIIDSTQRMCIVY